MKNLTYEKAGKTVTLNKSLAAKIDELLSHGLVCGLGESEPGKMCVEAAVNYACGFDHGDDPICVGYAVRSFKIQLNDSKWSSNKARAEGMRKIAIGQLGSDKINQVDFSKKIAIRIINVVISKLFSDLGFEKEAKSCADAKTLEEAIGAAESAEYAKYAGYAGYAAKYAAESAESAKSAAKSAKYAAKSAAESAESAGYAKSAAEYAEYAKYAKYAGYAAKYAAKYAKYAESAESAEYAKYAEYAAKSAEFDKYLILSADICFEVLSEMKSPGVELLNELDSDK